MLWCHLSSCLDVKLVCNDSGNFLEDSCDAAILAEGEYSAHLLPQGHFLFPILPKELQSIIQGSPTMAATSENLDNFLKIQIPEPVPRLMDSKCLGGGINVFKMSSDDLDTLPDLGGLDGLVHILQTVAELLNSVVSHFCSHVAISIIHLTPMYSIFLILPVSAYIPFHLLP